MPKLKKITIVTGIIFTLLIVSIVLRGWIRTDLVPMVVQTTYRGSVKNSYQHDFPPINDQLNKYGFKLSTVGNDNYGCSVTGFQLISETVYCNISTSSYTIRPDDAYKANWKQHSNEIESYLFGAGWHKEWNATQPIDEILDFHEGSVGIGVNYSKLHRKVFCNLSISYEPVVETAPTPYQNTLSAVESCGRQVKFFGGY